LLRNQLIAANATKPCLETMSPPGQPAADVVRLDFQVEQDFDANVGFNFLIVSGNVLAASHGTAINTLLVSFAAMGDTPTK
jgi:hypothetical protein